MSKPTLYLMLGYPGAGKTTVSELISKVTGAVHLNSDQFRLHMFKEPLGISETEHEYMYKMLDHITEQTLKSGKSVIYDANLNRHAHRQEKYDICKRTGAAAKLIWVKTDADEARKRATVEAAEHPEHRPFGNMDPDTFDRLVNQMEPPRDNETVIIVDGSRISEESIKNAITQD
ncbi:MAG TPA: ATP-binding protein [Candidatus Saccharimonadales bacterium]|nr:ATP-binding protein [Candidatus Saccharimonadales bacterium]